MKKLIPLLFLKSTCLNHMVSTILYKLILNLFIIQRFLTEELLEMTFFSFFFSLLPFNLLLLFGLFGKVRAALWTQAVTLVLHHVWISCKHYLQKNVQVIC